MKVLVIEDDPAIVRFLERALQAHGHDVTVAYDGEEGATAAIREPIDIVLLDIMLPRMDGHETLAHIRSRRPDLPVLMLTARDDDQHKVSALDGGADDYLTKPFSLEELMARMRALTRRVRHQVGPEMIVGTLRLDLPTRRAWRNNVELNLSSREFHLLEFFMRHPDEVLTRQQILSVIWQWDFDPASNLVDVYIRYLRKKIDLPNERSLISTVRGSGYRLDLAESDEMPTK